jgi:DNA-binding GntR family transcriptional regulator
MAGRSHTIQRQSVPEMVAISLRERILSGEFKDGEQIRQEAIAAEYDVSRMPVREALRQLEADGLVRLQTHKGAVVTTLSPEDVGELFDLRALLEPEILQRAIPLASSEDHARSEAVLERLEHAYRNSDTQSWGALNWEFHKSLYVPAQRHQTLSVLQTINYQTDRYVRLQLVLTSAIEPATRDHRELLRLCREKDRKRAGTYLAKHINDAKNALLAAMRARKSLAAE